MAACKEMTSCALLLEEFEIWLNETDSETIFLLESGSQQDGCVLLQLLLAAEHEFRLLCPSGYPNHEDNFFVEAGPAVRLWCNALNEYLLDAPSILTLKEVLNKAVMLHGNGKRDGTSPEGTDEEDGMEEDEIEEEDHEAMMMSDDDDDNTFTTKWELDIARKKKLWALKEAEIRDEMKKRKHIVACSEPMELEVRQASDQEQEQAQQIFSNTAASGVLTNDLVRILESEQELGLTAEPVDDNIYKWSVKLFDFEADRYLISYN
uniref:Uncharacterized protein LOC102805518 n=1 Tax=Saccoglossus kowalevskii TaxID=10224 RepID=A0ABM0MLL7_SACKO|nr:PREDICTED: uncharacterized protein LOC102805518 [Saccoglossus kowalevskii]